MFDLVYFSTICVHNLNRSVLTRLKKALRKKRGENNCKLTFCVSSWVLNEFISTKGTLHPYLEFKICKPGKVNWKENRTMNEYIDKI